VGRAPEPYRNPNTAVAEAQAALHAAVRAANPPPRIAAGIITVAGTETAAGLRLTGPAN